MPITTERSGSHLAVRRTGRPAREPISPRVEYRRRLVAFVELFTDAVRKPQTVYDLTRRDPRCQLPDEKQRQMIHDGIRAGMISRARVVAYRAQQLLDDFAQFPDEATALDVTYTQLLFEEAQAIEAQTIAHGLPTEANRDAAIRESREAIGVMELECRVLELYPLPAHPLPMGAHGAPR